VLRPPVETAAESGHSANVQFAPIVDRKLPATGERRGGTITGGNTVASKAGDFLTVPAGEPHVTMMRPCRPFRAIVFKIKQ